MAEKVPLMTTYALRKAPLTVTSQRILGSQMIWIICFQHARALFHSIRAWKGFSRCRNVEVP